MRKLLAILIVVGAINAGTTAGDFAVNPVSVRAVALGGCSTTVLDTASFYKNPATPKFYQKQSLSILQGKVFTDVNYLSVNYVQPEWTGLKLGLGLSFENAGIGGIPETTYDKSTGSAAETGSTFSYSGSQYLVSFSTLLTKDFAIGVNLKHLRESLYTSSAAGSGLDLGVLYQLQPKILIGVSAINLIKPTMTWSTEAAYPVDSMIMTGVSYQLNPEITLVSELQKSESRPIDYLGGIEYRPIPLLALRLGYGGGILRVGTGIALDNLILDYSYVNNSDKDLGLTQYISLSLIINNDLTLRNSQELDKAIQAEKKTQPKPVDIVLVTESIKAPVAQGPTIILKSPRPFEAIATTQPTIVIDITDPDGVSMSAISIIVSAQGQEINGSGGVSIINQGYSIFVKPDPLPENNTINISVAAKDLAGTPASAAFTFNTVQTYAEISPLPLPTPETIPYEEQPTLNLPVTADVVVPIPQTVTAVTTVNIPEESVEPFYNYQLVVVSLRYYDDTQTLLCKAFVDNSGNQLDTITVSTTVSLDQKKITSFPAQTITINAQETGVYYFKDSIPLQPGTYTIETEAQSATAKKYLKQQWIRR
jgi:hypothetical protein